jgi:hypothetical protein
VFNVPVFLTTVETKGFSGYLWPQVQAVFPKQEPIATGQDQLTKGNNP